MFTNVPLTKVSEVTALYKVINAKEDRNASIQKAKLVIEKFKALKLTVAAKIVEEGIR